MKAVAWAAGALAVAIVAVMCGAGLLVTVIMAPAVQAELEEVECTGAIAATGAWQPPIAGRYVVSDRGFGPRFHPIHLQWRNHAGQDMSGTPGPGTIVAVGDGKVTHAGVMGGYGNAVDVQHADGVTSRYAHLASITVRTGQKVTAGTQLGIEGTTGQSTGVHLHFEIHVNGAPVDPKAWMAKQGAPLNGKETLRRPDDGETPADAEGLGEESDAGEGGLGFDLPKPTGQRQDSLHNPPTPIPPEIKKLYVQAGKKYGLPWTLLAGVGMSETNHGRNTAVSSAGAQGHMQFMPATFATMGTDGDGDGRADIHNTADSIFSAARYLVHEGATRGPDGVVDALFAYNRAKWYGQDVLFYAAAYGGGSVLGDPSDCDPGTGPETGNPNVPPLTNPRLEKVLAFALDQDGDQYVLGGNGPDQWDCSSLTMRAYSQVGIDMPRTAQAQRDWLAQGNGTRIQPGDERPGDLVFWNSYLGPERIGHVAMVLDPKTKTTIDARSRAQGVGKFSYATAHEKQIFEIWRVGNVKAKR
ncbi:peptidoglycan DD-metalloendopeptidase family protein [Janibacter indicus]|uniref:Peptidoglycan DD-metalloendopeptidase family protein n=1 Tax=Janibacter indicus TaxID=857417 RepID=A0A7L9IZ12_9MICO|nr:peptidoglycan DD-metalloendopeptidase family protein [Janibacter indicus]QOK22354.1 peptidoglycan DD-metalloendopeptidase family protein [Janibacter indicus]